MKRIITILAVLAMLAPAASMARDSREPAATPETGSGGGGGGADYDLSDYVLERGDFAPNGPSGQSAEIDPVLEDLITAFCGDRDVVIIFNDDGLIEDWDCD